MKKSNLIAVRVPVPQDRLSEFYQLLGDFFDEDSEQPVAAAKSLDTPGGGDGWKAQYKSWTGPDDQEAATHYWKHKLNRNGKAMLSELARHPEQRFTGEEIANLLGLDGPSQVAGVLAWPGRYAYQMGYQLPTEWDQPTEDDPGGYWMKPEVAELFRKAASMTED